MNKRMLIVEDEADIREYLMNFFRDKGYVVYGAADGANAMKVVERKPPDVAIVDLGLPKVDGESVCRDLKAHYPDIIVIILTARKTSRDVVHGFNLGADDYISKPFIAEELAARVEVRLKGGQPSAQTVHQIADLTVDPNTYEVKRGSKSIELTQKEYQLLEYLIMHKNTVLTREAILNKVWYFTPEIESRVVDVYIGYLRKKIDTGSKKKLIVSKRGFGYMLKEN